MMKIKLYTTESCPFCIAAKNLLKAKKFEFKEIDLTSNIELRLEISVKYDCKTVPIIIINDKFIGGFNKLNELNSSGELQNFFQIKSV